MGAPSNARRKRSSLSRRTCSTGLPRSKPFLMATTEGFMATTEARGEPSRRARLARSGIGVAAARGHARRTSNRAAVRHRHRDRLELGVHLPAHVLEPHRGLLALAPRVAA